MKPANTVARAMGPALVFSDNEAAYGDCAIGADVRTQYKLWLKAAGS